MIQSLIKKLPLILILVLFLISCGKKSPPYLPKSRLPFRVIVPKAEKENGIWTIKGEVAGKIGKRGFRPSDITGCIIYYSKYSLKNPPCESCPLYYGESRIIEAKVVKDGHFSVKLPWIKKKGIYYLRIRLTGINNSIGPPSDRVRIEIKE